MERVGGYGNIIKSLREKDTSYVPSPEPQKTTELLTLQEPAELYMDLPGMTSSEHCLDACPPRNVLILDKMGHGKSTVGNKLLNSNRSFRISSRKCPQTCNGSALLKSASQLKSFLVTVLDHDGLFEGASTINGLSSDVFYPLNVAIFVLKHGRSFDENEEKILEAVVCKWKIIQILALVITHCERLSEEEREKMINQFKENHPSVAELMGKGILAVGFPDGSHVQPGSQLSQSVEKDRKKLRQLIYLCDEPVFIL